MRSYELALAGVLFAGLACAPGGGQGMASTSVAPEMGTDKLIGLHTLTAIAADGANIPERYRAFLDAFGEMSVGCTATHIGNGLVLTAGHCFQGTPTRKDNAPCPDVKVQWGVRQGRPSYLTSTCQTVLAFQTSKDIDYALFKVTPVPPVSVDVDPLARPPDDSTLVIFQHPQMRPLEYSQGCPLRPASSGNVGLNQFSHQCDTEPGSSGSTVLSDDFLTVVGIHDGGLVPWNYGSFLADSPLGEFVPSAPLRPVVTVNTPATGALVTGDVQVSADATVVMGSISKVTFELPGQTQPVTVSSAPFVTTWSSTTVANGTQALRVVAYDASGTASYGVTRSVSVSN